MKYNREKPTLWGLFINTFVISAATIGGGYVMIPIFREKFGKKLGWISDDEILSLIALGLVAVAAAQIIVETLWGTGAITLVNADVFAAVLAVAAFVMLRKRKLGVILTILACGAIGVIQELVSKLIK